MGDRGHQDDRHEAGHRDRVPADARSTEARSLARSGHRVRGRGQAEGVDDGDHAIGEEQQVDDEDGQQRRRAGRLSQQTQARAGVDEQAAAQGDDEDHGRGERQGTAVEADVGLTEAGKEKRQKGGREGRSVPALVTGALLHRAG